MLSSPSLLRNISATPNRRKCTRHKKHWVSSCYFLLPLHSPQRLQSCTQRLTGSFFFTFWLWTIIKHYLIRSWHESALWHWFCCVLSAGIWPMLEFKWIPEICVVWMVLQNADGDSKRNIRTWQWARCQVQQLWKKSDKHTPLVKGWFPS